ncbi:hypothetical protein BJV78DRAFT_1280997 [Lactifluus subvellereus]|nr:hypothetical protein BJV78DRAFT_1280997 [Lactifluus subvellereus]
MSSLLTNYSFLSPLKRQRAVRNRSNNATPTPSKRANRLPVVAELSAEQDSFFDSMSSASSSSSVSSFISPNRKRLSRYGKDQFTLGGTFHLDDDFLSNAPRAAPHPPPPASGKPMRQSVRLSAFDIIIDIPASEPASPISETPIASSTPPRPRDLRLQSPHRARSPTPSLTPSLTSMSACSSTEMPITPGASDDEWSYLQPSRKAIASPLVSFHPLVITRSTPSLLDPGASPVETFEFTLAPLSPLPGTEAEEEEDEDDASWYVRELSQVVSLSSPSAPSSTSPARPDSLPPPPRGSGSNTSRSAGRSRMSKPLPALPRTPGPSPQMDPTFPRRKSRPTRPPLPTSSHPPSPLPPPASPVPLAPRRKSLTITVPRALSHTPLSLDVSEIMDDATAWSLAQPSGRTNSGSHNNNSGSGSSNGATQFSPPRMPQSPASSTFPEYDPIELIVGYAALPPSPTPSSTEVFSEGGCGGDGEGDKGKEKGKEVDDKDNNDDDDDNWAVDEGLRSRWSCSTLATLVPSSSSPQTPPSASSRLRFHLGSVARRVRVLRAGVSSEDAVVPKVHLRSASESALAWGGGASPPLATEAATGSRAAASGLRRKPIPLELFLR